MNKSLYSWGHYPNLPQQGHPQYWGAEIPAQLNSIVSQNSTTLPFGNGRSYGDSCLASSNHVLHMRSLNRFIKFDWENGILTAESGVTLDEILAVIVPKGWFLSVTPGTQFITLGGAIANDVHGKNHHQRGTFGNHVSGFGLLRHNHPEIITCTPNENAELFSATIGGLGLTGIITWVEIRLIPIKSSQINSTTLRFNNLTEFFSLSSELDLQHDYTVAWIDCLAKNQHLGRGVFTVGNHAENNELELKQKFKLNIPVTPPISLINNLSLRAFNEVYWKIHSAHRIKKLISYEPFFYPLDSILNWNRIYGKKGFQQYQCVIPEAEAEVVIPELLSTIANSGQGSFLAVLKRCGHIKSSGLLSFPLPGTTLALDFPQNNNLEQTLFPRLDTIVRNANGRLYPAKDAHMSGDDFRKAYPAWEQLEALRDPALNSHFWKRVTL